VARDQQHRTIAAVVCDKFDCKAASEFNVEAQTDPLTALVAGMRRSFAREILTGRLSSMGVGYQSKMLHVHLVGALREQRGADLTVQLMQMTFARARVLGYTHAFVECTGPISAHIFVNKLKFTPLISLSPHYGEYMLEDSKPFQPIVFESRVPGADSRFLVAICNLN